MKIQICLLISLSVFGSFSADATFLRVPTEYPTIQAAVDVALDGDTVLLADGVYSGNGNRGISIYNRAVSIRSETGPSHCVVDCEGNTYAFLFARNGTRQILLQGITIENGSQYKGGGLHASWCNLAVRDCIFQNNHAQAGGGAIFIEDCRSPSVLFDRCLIQNNTANGGGGLYLVESRVNMIKCCVTGNNAGEHGGGLRLDQCMDCSIADTIISGNQSMIQGAGILDYCSQFVTISNCTVCRNSANENGGGIYFWGTGHSDIVSCVISNNYSGGEGGGIYFSTTNRVELSDCEIGYNECDDYGAGISWKDSELATLSHCVFNSNVSGQNGGAIGFSYVDDASITNCLFSQNSAGQNGGCFHWFFSTSAQIKNCTLTDNVAGNEGGAIYSDQTAPQIDNSIIYFNSTPPINTSACEIRFSDVEGGYSGQGNIDLDPLFIEGPRGDYYLSQIRAGQPENSPCLEAPNAYSADVCFESTAGEICMDQLTTGTDFEADFDHVDMGFHYDRTLLPFNDPMPPIPFWLQPIPVMRERTHR